MLLLDWFSAKTFNIFVYDESLLGVVFKKCILKKQICHIPDGTYIPKIEIYDSMVIKFFFTVGFFAKYYCGRIHFIENNQTFHSLHSYQEAIGRRYSKKLKNDSSLKRVIGIKDDMWILKSWNYKIDIAHKLEERDIHILLVKWPDFKLITPNNKYIPDITIFLNINYIPNNHLKSECKLCNITEKDKEETLKRRKSKIMT